MSGHVRDDGYRSDPPTTGAVIAGVVLGTIAGIVLQFLLAAVPFDGTGFPMLIVAIAAPAIIGVALLLIPSSRRAGAGFVMGLAIGGIVAAGVCTGFMAWLSVSLG